MYLFSLTMKKTLLIPAVIMLLSLLLHGCKKIYEDFETPSVSIISVKTLAKDSCVIGIKTDQGVGASFHKYYLDFYDLTDVNNHFTCDLTLSGNKLDSSWVKIKMPTQYHDYKVRAVLESDKNVYSSSYKVVYLSSDFNNTDFGIKYIDFYNSGIDGCYADESQGIGSTPLKGKWVSLNVHYTKFIPLSSSVVVKLNDNITLPASVSSSGSITDGALWCQPVIPENLDAGDYTVSVYINGVKYLANSKLRSYPGSSVIQNITPPSSSWYDYGSLLTCFKLGNKVYYVYRQPAYSVIVYDLESKVWMLKNKLPDPVNVTESVSWINETSFVYGGKSYILPNVSNKFDSSNSRIELWRYDDAIDNWTVETRYPGKAGSKTFAFVVGDKLYMGGGSGGYGMDVVADFWEYDFTTKKWLQKKDLSNYMATYAIASCASSNNGYVFTGNRELYQYNVAADQWQKISTLNGGPIFRNSSTLLYQNGTIYLSGGYTFLDGAEINLTDTWTYNLTTGNWSLRNRYNANPNIPFEYSKLPTYFYNDRLYVGFAYEYYTSQYYNIVITP